MTTSISKMLVLLAAFAVTTPAATTLVPTGILSTATAATVLKGRVVTNTGAALEGARVQLMRQGVANPVSSTQSAADGSYELTLPSAPGVYTLRVLSIGFAPETFVLTRANGQWAAPSEVVMSPIPAEM